MKVVSIFFLISLFSSVLSQGHVTTYSFFESTNFADDNTFVSIVTPYPHGNFTCDGQKYLGPFSTDQKLEKNFTSIAAHFSVYVEFTLILVDSNRQGAVSFFADDIQYANLAYRTADREGADICGSRGNELPGIFNASFDHTDPRLKLDWIASKTST